MASNIFAGLLVIVAALPSSWAQSCPNEVAQYNGNLRTTTSNSTWLIVPAPRLAVQSALDATYPPAGTVVLADVPSSNTSLFPSGFDSDMHPVLVSAGYSDDIRMGDLQIDGGYLSGTLYAPYVRRPNSSTDTILTAPLSNYLAGPNNNAVAGLVPNTVSTLIEGFQARLGQFAPTDAAYQVNSGNVLSNKVAWQIVPNPLSGPGIYPEAYDLQFTSSPQHTKTTPELLKVMLNQPAILSEAYLSTNTCQRNQYYFNNATSIMVPRAGNVTFGDAADRYLPGSSGILQAASSGGFYPGDEGYTACAQVVGYNPEDCDQAAENVDQTAL